MHKSCFTSQYTKKILNLYFCYFTLRLIMNLKRKKKHLKFVKLPKTFPVLIDVWDVTYMSLCSIFFKQETRETELDLNISDLFLFTCMQ